MRVAAAARLLGWVWHDIRHGMRAFVKMPLFTAIAVVSIAFGTGANVAIFSAVDALLLRPPPVPRPHELLTIGTRVDRGLGSLLRMSHADYLDVRARQTTFAGLLAYGFRRVSATADPRLPVRMTVAAVVSANYFEALGVRPQLGRAFLSDEDRVPGRDAVVVLSDDTWREQFLASPDVIGRTIRLAGIDFTIVGVAPRAFTGLDPYTKHEVYVPLAMWARIMNSADYDPLADRNLRVLTVAGRLKPGVGLAAAQADLATIGASLAETYPATNRSRTVTAQTELQMRFERRPLDTRTLALLSMLSIAVLCLACANVAGLLASRAPARTREIALRLAVGAARSRIVTQLIAESLAIALAGGIGGVLVGYAGISVFRRIEWPSDAIIYPVFEMDERTLAVALVAAIVSVFLFGVSPSIQTARVDLTTALRASDVSPPRVRRLRGRNVLVAAQIALSLAVLTIASFIFQVFQRELSGGPGFRTTHLVLGWTDPSQARYSREQSVQLIDRAIEQARQLPGSVSAAASSEIPMWGLEISSIVPEGYRPADGRTGPRIYQSSVDESYFDTMAIPLVSGRPFRRTDDAEAPRVAIINESLARRFWPDGNAVGQRFRLKDDSGPWIEIVGVAKASTYVYTGEPAFEVAYFPYRQEPRTTMALLVQTAGDSSALLQPLRQMMLGIDPDVPLYDVQTIEHFYRVRATSINGLALTMIGGLGLMGLTLAVVGLYGLVSYDVGRRTREIGVRIAIGASPRRVLTLVIRDGMGPAWAGLLVGLVLSALTARTLPILVPIGARYDIGTVLAVVPIMLLVTLTAAGIPARRAGRVDPTIALRAE